MVWITGHNGTASTYTLTQAWTRQVQPSASAPHYRFSFTVDRVPALHDPLGPLCTFELTRTGQAASRRDSRPRTAPRS